MQVAVVGGTGSVGSLIVVELAARGDAVRILSRNPPAELPSGASHHRIDLAIGGAGLIEAFDGVEAVVDASNDSSRKAGKVLVEGGRRIADAEQEAGVRHHVAISIVGCDRVPVGYYRTKVAQERVVTESPVPWSLLRASQFHTLVAYLFQASERYRIAPTGKALIQPIDPAIVAKRLAEAVHDGPGGRLPDIAGPKVETLTDLAHAWREHSDRRSIPLRLPMIGPVGRALREGALTAPSAAAGGQTFEQWLSGQAPRGGS